MVIDDRDVDLGSVKGWFRATGTDDGTVVMEHCVNGLGAGFFFVINLDDARRVHLAIGAAISEAVAEGASDQVGDTEGRKS